MNEMVAPHALAAAARSDKGRVRGNNEDVPIFDAARGIFGVVDGVGGQAAGELAATIARDVILQRLARPLGTPAERVREAIAIANNEIVRRAGSSPELAGMTCVVTLAAVADGRLTVGHVGDTRLYKLRAGGMVKLTHDHSPVGEREDAGELGEAEAMRHPRRHEVYRDVGSLPRDKDDDEFVDVVEDALEEDAALLICSDGLTDMITTAAIDAIVRAHAGDPQAVVDALVDAANEAGGRDNVTVVYAEGPRFAATVGAASSEPRPGRVRRAVRAAAASRLAWFVAGAALGLCAALALTWRMAEADVPGPRILVVSPPGTPERGSLAAALAEARAGDVVRLEPGTYAERVTVPDGVSLTARVAGSAVFARADPAVPGEADWVAVTATGESGGVVSGIRIVSSPERPVAVGIRVVGHGRTIALVETEGTLRAGVELAADSSSALHGSRFLSAGPAVVLSAGSSLDVTGSLFRRRSPAMAAGTRSPRPTEPAIALGDDARVVVRHSVFTGFGPDPVPGLAADAREHLRADNVVVSADPSIPR